MSVTIYALDYRLVYARLHHRSDEALVVGVLYQHETKVKARFVDQQKIHGIFSQLVNDEWLDQIFFSIRVQREALRAGPIRFFEICPSTSLLRFGRIGKALTRDVDVFARDLLKSSTVLYGRFHIVAKRKQTTVGQKEVQEAVKREIVRIDPLRGRQIVSPRRIVLDKREIEIPLFGERLIGAPISMHRVDPHDALPNAEHWLLRLNYAKKFLMEKGLHRIPSLYLYSPDDEDENRSRRTKGVSSEIQEIGEAIGVAVRKSSSIEGLAATICEDEHWQSRMQ